MTPEEIFKSEVLIQRGAMLDIVATGAASSGSMLTFQALRQSVSAMTGRINPQAQKVINRLAKIDYEKPKWNAKKVVEALEKSYAILEQRMPQVEIANDLVVGFEIARGAARGAAWDAARGAARDAARGAARDAARGAARGPAWDAAELAGALNSEQTDPATLKWITLNTEILKALENGLSWYFPMKDRLVLVPLPRMVIADKQLHYDHGKAVEWSNGTGYYFLRGVRFDEKLYNQIIEEKITLNNLGKITNADQRAVAVQMFRPDRLLKQVKAELISTGVKGTKLYRVKRFMGRPKTEYCMLMTHPSISNKQYIEWVEPRVGEMKSADLAQCWAWRDEDGDPVPLEDYLGAIES